MFVESQLILIFFLVIIFKNLLQKRKYINFIIYIFFSTLLYLELISYLMTSQLIDYRFFIHLDIKTIKTFLFQFKIEFLLFSVFYILIFYFIFIKKFDFIKNYKKTHLTISLLFFCAIALPNKSAIYKFYEIYSIYNKNLFYSSEISIVQNKKKNERFINKLNLNDYFNKKSLDANQGKNIIFLSLESLDSGFIQGTKNLTPNLNKIIKDNYYVKIYPNEGCNWTIGSHYCLFTGLPSFFSFSPNKIFQGLRNIKIITLADIFKEANYDIMEYYVGQSEFAGTYDFFNTLGFDVRDYSDSTGDYRTYENTFGYHDKDLFYELKKRIKYLSENNKSFTIFASTINTHLNGIYDKRMSQYITDIDNVNNLEHSVRSLDHLIGDFFNFLVKENILKNTVLFISPDHLLPNNKSLNETIKKINVPDRSLYLISSKELDINDNKYFQINLPKIVLETAQIENNHEYFYESKDLLVNNDFIKKNLDSFSRLNDSIVEYYKTPQKIEVNIKDNILKIFNNNEMIYSSLLNLKKLSNINLIFDKNFIFKPFDYEQESLYQRKINLSDEMNSYYYLNIIKNNNKIIKATILNTKKKEVFNLPISDLENKISFEPKKYLNNSKIKNFIRDKKRFIAHAGGSIDENIYTNSLEALNLNYKKGFRLFELDLNLTTDDFIVAAHDWKMWNSFTSSSVDTPPTLSEFNSKKILGIYSPLDAKQISNWFNQREDAILVTDKIKDIELLELQIKIPKERVIIEVFNKESLFEAKSRGYKVIVDLNFLKKIEDPLTFLKNNNIEFISSSVSIVKKLDNNILNFVKTLFYTPLEKKLVDENYKIYAYHLNDKNLNIDEINLICNYSEFFYGMYADNWSFDNKKQICS